MVTQHRFLVYSIVIAALSLVSGCDPRAVATLTILTDGNSNTDAKVVAVIADYVDAHGFSTAKEEGESEIGSSAIGAWKKTDWTKSGRPLHTFVSVSKTSGRIVLEATQWITASVTMEQRESLERLRRRLLEIRGVVGVEAKMQP